MRLLLLGGFFLAGLATISVAQNSQMQSATGDEALAQKPRSEGHLIWKLRPEGDAYSEEQDYCAYIRVYRVKRQSHGSDRVSPAGYTTCVPAKRFEYKSAVFVPSERVPRD